ncbi:tRNA1(Val) (adenine(37)-N6)-methyltransferase [Vibrio sp. WJH972]
MTILHDEKTFHFKQFAVTQKGCGMPVSTDGILLGAWFDVESAQRLLDIGTGTGLLALMAAQRFPEISIDAIEIDSTACKIAQHNIDNSNWAQRISVLQRDLLSFTSTANYDAIVCNPPYFTNGESAQSIERATARHTLHFTHETLLKCCYQLLSAKGKASFILPIIEGNNMIEHAKQAGWHLSRYCEIQTTPRKPTSRVLFELTKKKSSSVEQRNLIIQQDGHYSVEFIKLTKAFYLKM